MAARRRKAVRSLFNSDKEREAAAVAREVAEVVPLLLVRIEHKLLCGGDGDAPAARVASG
eukprot:1368142-Pleurochrysis_carterae.AAC.1